MSRWDDDEGGDDHVAAFEAGLREVLEISEMMDRFDLVSADKESCMRFRRLRTLYVTRAAAFIMMIEEHSIDLRDQLLALVRDS